MAELSGAEKLVSEHLEKIGAQFSKQHFTGDSSFPTEYRIAYGGLTIVQPTLELALIDLIERQSGNGIEQRLSAVETATQLLSGNILGLRSDMAVVKRYVDSLMDEAMTPNEPAASRCDFNPGG